MTYEALRHMVRNEALPTALVDLAAVRANTEHLASLMGDRVTLRVASKSIRHVGLMKRIFEWGGPRFQGVMTFSAAESALLAEHGFDDLLLAYPVSRAPEAQIIADLAANGTTIRATVDHPDHLAVLSAAAARAGSTVEVCVDIDASWRVAGQHLGVRRSPLRGVTDALALARIIRETPHLELKAVLAYEAQIAGMRDVTPGSRLLDPFRAMIKARSKPMVKERRRSVVEALQHDGFAIELVNGGGTGSIAFTSEDMSVTEVTAGSGFLCPHLFDGYHGLTLTPASFFALPVSRVSDAGFVTCAGGGYPASGEAGADRLPTVHLPKGMKPVDLEGFGEVQTPLHQGDVALKIGDPVFCRHAKAGELAERFAEYLLYEDGEIVAREPSYRGMGACFP